MKNTAEVVWCAGIVVAIATGILAGCAGSKPATTDSAQGASVSGEAKSDQPASGGAELGLSGSDLWSQNCAFCHNSVSPTSYSDGQWDVIVTHMRIQARLTGEEERKIRQFLQASN